MIGPSAGISSAAVGMTNPITLLFGICRSETPLAFTASGFGTSLTNCSLARWSKVKPVATARAAKPCTCARFESVALDA